MEPEELINLLQKLIEYVETAQHEASERTDKFQIALSNTMRLTAPGDSTLSRLQGTPDDLLAYLIRLSTDLCKSYQEHLAHISKNLEDLVDALPMS